ncbi:MAG: hypothetical protein AAGA55_09285 [Planctomycetota bacterium]
MSRMSLPAQVAAMLVCVASIAACNTTTRESYLQIEGGTAGVRLETSTGQNLEFNTVHILDRDLQDWRGPDGRRASRILVQATNASLTPTSTVRAWAILQNRTTGPLTIQARTQFFRPDQSPLEQPTAWEPIVLSGGGVFNYEAFSLSQATDVGFYYIEVKGL